MKKLLTILLILSTGIAYGQAFPCHSVCQTNSQRAFMKQSLDSLRVLITAEIKTEFAKLPLIRKGTVDSLNSLNAYLSAIDRRLTSLEQSRTVLFDSITRVSNKVPDITPLQRQLSAFTATIQELTNQFSEVKVWADKLRLKTYTIDFK